MLVMYIKVNICRRMQAPDTTRRPWYCRVADIFAQMNNKMSGDLKKIQVTGKYFVEIWKAIGMESINDKVYCLVSQDFIASESCQITIAGMIAGSRLHASREDNARNSGCNSQVLFLNASEEINSNPHEYNALMLDIARSFNLNRIKKCTQIMGREESDDLSAAQIFYPCMQCADIFFLKVKSSLLQQKCTTR
jgi:tyrosyl-tRNA synthetase